MSLRVKNLVLHLAIKKKELFVTETCANVKSSEVHSHDFLINYF